MKKQKAILQNWCHFRDRLIGEVWNHPSFDNGSVVRTSVIVSPPDSIREGGQVETQNTIYDLQEQSTKHEDKFIGEQ